MNENEIYFFEPVELEIESFSSDGYVLDIGGGGEGIIGRLPGLHVISIDRREDELTEAPDGPLKIVMDARNLKFTDSSFSVVTAFFSFMYFKTEADIQAALTEAYRVLKPGGSLRMWDVSFESLPDTDQPLFAVQLRCKLNAEVCETAYGCPWPNERRDHQFYRHLAECSGFKHDNTTVSDHIFHSTFIKNRLCETI